MAGESWSARAIAERLEADDALTRELVALFLSEYPKMLAAVRDSVARGVAEDIRKSAHALKGSVSNFTDGAPVHAALAVEILAREGRVEAAAAALDALEREMRLFVAELETFIRS
jgi:two-component system sensor histidine kinase/response regulator